METGSNGRRVEGTIRKDHRIGAKYLGGITTKFFEYYQ